MNLYLIEQSENNGYDTFDSAVVCCESHEEAQRIVPGQGYTKEHSKELDDKYWTEAKTSTYPEWATRPELVSVTLIGTAEESVKLGVVCASYNAG